MSTENQEVQTSYLDMSDEDLLAIDPSTVGMPADEAAEDVGDTDGGAEASDDIAADAEPSDTDGQDDEDGSDDPVEKTEVVGKPEAQDTGTEPVVAEKATPAEVVESKIDYEAEYKRLLTPFKANGKDIVVNNIEDAISLMQMGANYNKKMAGLKPNLKLMKLLETSGLLSEEKIGYLIDLANKNPGAINKLVQDSGIDPMDLGTEQAKEYKPTTYKVDDREMELEAVLDDIQDTPTFSRTLDIVSTKWDAKSKDTIAGSPQLLKVINDHVHSGIYDIIIKEVDNQRMFGRLDGLSDFEAYRKVGDAIQERDGFGNLGHQEKQTPTKPVIVVPKPSKAEEDKLRDKKRAASSSKPAGASSVKQEYNPLALSDEEFIRLSAKQFG